MRAEGRRATSGMSVCYGEELRNVVLTSQPRPGGIPSGERGRGVTVRIPNQNASQNARRAPCKFETCKLRPLVTHLARRSRSSDRKPFICNIAKAGKRGGIAENVIEAG